MNPLREAAELLRKQLIQKRKEVEELEALWKAANKAARDAEGGFVGYTSWKPSDWY